ncbi:hypothetical protein GALMADRAFT_1196783 [Galerina marginata CBS 339.88]|uniref:Uncharacterized protein n=1 Tax=Galerina marginata (strain CBS 339.88) TaxID=685588 RepID=A0A067TDJ6_GALM3|nr:hypothetical protein GALMADRAFT_1196783 [Galerina marginata CBS 339.88]
MVGPTFHLIIDSVGLRVRLSDPMEETLPPDLQTTVESVAIEADKDKARIAGASATQAAPAEAPFIGSSASSALNHESETDNRSRVPGGEASTASFHNMAVAESTTNPAESSSPPDNPSVSLLSPLGGTVEVHNGVFNAVAGHHISITINVYGPALQSNPANPAPTVNPIVDERRLQQAGRKDRWLDSMRGKRSRLETASKSGALSLRLPSYVTRKPRPHTKNISQQRAGNTSTLLCKTTSLPIPLVSKTNIQNSPTPKSTMQQHFGRNMNWMANHRRS